MVNIKSGIILLLAYWSIALVANDNFEIRSTVSKSKIYQNETVILTLSVNGADKDLYKEIVRPKLDQQFTIISTSQSSSFLLLMVLLTEAENTAIPCAPLSLGYLLLIHLMLITKERHIQQNPFEWLFEKDKLRERIKDSLQRLGHSQQ